jgi:hypothetical protein
MGIFDKLKDKLNPAKIITETVMEVADGAADIVDRFVQNPEEKEAALQALREFKLAEREIAADKEAALLADRQSARGMAGIHGKLQKTFSMVFLVGFLALVVGEFAFIGLIIYWETTGTAPLSDWAKTLIATLLSGVLGYMVSMLKEITGFLFGGSAGGDDVTAQLGDAIQNATGGRKEE